MLAIAVTAAAACMPLNAFSQIIEEKPAAPQTESGPKYEVYAGWGYTSLNQVNQSRNGLQGVEVGATRDFGKHFGLTGMYGHYAWAITSSNTDNPSVDMFLAGPELHAPLYERWNAYARALFGAVHTGNVSIEPGASFAGGGGIGIEYQIRPRISLRLGGDNIGSAFTATPYESGASTHTRWNAHAYLNVAYKF